MKIIKKVLRILPINLPRLIGIVLVLIIILIITSSSAYSPRIPTNISSLCNLTGLNYGTDSLKVTVPRSSVYTIWVQVEAPVSISYNVLPQLYNPFFISVDNNSCYKVGGASMPLDSWVWINYLDGNTYNYFKVNLSAGSHIVSMAGIDLSVDRVLAVSGQCIPSGNGSNCVPKESQTYNY